MKTIYLFLNDDVHKDMNQEFLNSKLLHRKAEGSLRTLRAPSAGIDFSSNDYLGLAKSGRLSGAAGSLMHGSTGSRLLTGNSAAAEELEETIARFHSAEAALLFNSGYDANVGLLSCVASRTDTILYDELSHASIRDGARMSHARSFHFKHNDPEDLDLKISQASGRVFVVTESVFSMDGDIPPVQPICDVCRVHGALLIVDEAHATAMYGPNGEGLMFGSGLAGECFARVFTYGKAAGCHGAAVAGSRLLRDYLINFSRPFIYTTALPPSSIEAISSAYKLFPGMHEERTHIRSLVSLFRSNAGALPLVHSDTAIQGIMLPRQDQARCVAGQLAQYGFDVRPILSPTVAVGTERLRIVLHAFNTPAEVRGLIEAAVEAIQVCNKKQ